MKYWIMKSEPSEVSIDDLAKFDNQQVEWFGVRNYQARNFMRDQMKLGDLAFFWHSSCKNPGVYGIVKVATNPHPDSTQFNVQSEYFDPKSNAENPRWWCIDVSLVAKTKYLSIQELREYPELKDMQVLKKGNRLSITPVTHDQLAFLNKIIAN